MNMMSRSGRVDMVAECMCCVSLVQVGCYGNGAAIGYWQGTPERLIDDLKVIILHQS